MIELTRLNRHSFVLNSDLVETVENTPDTVITLITGQKLLVREDASEVVRRVIEFRAQVGTSRSLMSLKLAPGDGDED
jgi:flagellar protein FlbD